MSSPVFDALNSSGFDKLVEIIHRKDDQIAQLLEAIAFLQDKIKVLEWPAEQK